MRNTSNGRRLGKVILGALAALACTVGEIAGAAAAEESCRDRTCTDARNLASGDPFLVEASLANATQTAMTKGDPASLRLYARFLAIGAYSRLGDVKNTGSLGTGTGSDNNDDYVAGLGLAVGLHLDPIYPGLRAEIELDYRFRYDYDARPAVTGPGTPPRGGVTSDLASQSLFLNVAKDFHVANLWDRPLNATIGGGVGISRHESDATFTDLDLIDAGTGTPDDRDDVDFEFSFAFMAGLNYDITETVRLGLGYRYADLGHVEMGPFDNGLALTAKDYETHDVILSVSYTF